MKFQYLLTYVSTLIWTVYVLGMLLTCFETYAIVKQIRWIIYWFFFNRKIVFHVLDLVLLVVRKIFASTKHWKIEKSGKNSFYIKVTAVT